ncbi:hypothetical protein ABKN59_010588 [Abortiporus biennis]
MPAHSSTSALVYFDTSSTFTSGGSTLHALQKMHSGRILSLPFGRPLVSCGSLEAFTSRFAVHSLSEHPLCDPIIFPYFLEPNPVATIEHRTTGDFASRFERFKFAFTGTLESVRRWDP